MPFSAVADLGTGRRSHELGTDRIGDRRVHDEFDRVTLRIVGRPAGHIGYVLGIKCYLSSARTFLD